MILQTEIPDLNKPRLGALLCVHEDILCMAMQGVTSKMTDHQEQSQLSLVQDGRGWQGS